MSVYICENYQEKNVSCIKLGAGKYSAIISPEYGSSVWRMRDEESDMEIFRYNSKVTAKEINKAREIWGLPTLYLPNGNPFNGVIITDLENGRKICNEVSKEFKFWNIWNDKGYNGYFCPEPMTAMINSPNLSLPPEISGYSELAPGEKYSCWQ